MKHKTNPALESVSKILSSVKVTKTEVTEEKTTHTLEDGKIIEVFQSGEVVTTRKATPVELAKLNTTKKKSGLPFSFTEEESKNTRTVNEVPPKKTKKGRKPNKNTETTEDTKTLDKNAFIDTVERYERAFIENGYKLPLNDKTLLEISTAIFHSVTKTIIKTTADELIKTIKNATTRQLKQLQNIELNDKTETKIAYNTNGDLQIIESKQYSDSVKVSFKESLSNGFDAINAISISVLEESKKALAGGELSIGFLSQVYEVRKTKGSVIIGQRDIEWKTEEITPIQMIFRAGSSFIRKEKSITVSVNGYTYKEEKTTDAQSGEVATIYRRLPKYIDLGSYYEDFNGKTIAYKVNDEVLKVYDEFVAKMKESKKFNANHFLILELFLRGYGKEEAINKVGLSERTGGRYCTAIQNFAFEIELANEKYYKKPSSDNASKPKKIIAIHLNSGTETVHESVTKCAKELQIDKSSICKVLSKGRGSAKGYKFKYYEESESNEESKKTEN